MAAIVTDAQLEQIRMTATQIPRRLRNAYLQRVVQLLNGRDFGDGDVHRSGACRGGRDHAPAAPGASWPVTKRELVSARRAHQRAAPLHRAADRGGARDAVACGDDGHANFDRIRYRHYDASVFLYAFDLIELDGIDLRRDGVGARRCSGACSRRRLRTGSGSTSTSRTRTARSCSRTPIGLRVSTPAIRDG